MRGSGPHTMLQGTAAAIGSLPVVLDKAGVAVSPWLVLSGGLVAFAAIAYGAWDRLRTNWPRVALLVAMILLLVPSTWWLSRWYYIGFQPVAPQSAATANAVKPDPRDKEI